MILDRRVRTSVKGQLRFQRDRIGGNPDILGVVDVAKALRCSEDAVRRIPQEKLPAHNGPGKHVLYLRSELITYVQNLSATRRLNAEDAPAPALRLVRSDFDPRAAARALGKSHG